MTLLVGITRAYTLTDLNAVFWRWLGPRPLGLTFGLALMVATLAFIGQVWSPSKAVAGRADPLQPLFVSAILAKLIGNLGAEGPASAAALATISVVAFVWGLGMAALLHRQRERGLGIVQAGYLLMAVAASALQGWRLGADLDPAGLCSGAGAHLTDAAREWDIATVGSARVTCGLAADVGLCQPRGSHQCTCTARLGRMGYRRGRGLLAYHALVLRMARPIIQKIKWLATRRATLVATVASALAAIGLLVLAWL